MSATYFSFKGKGNSTFGGKVIVFCGDFGQILSSFKHYQCYNKFFIYLGQLLDVDDEKLSEPNDGYARIEIPEQFLITNYDNSIHAIVKSIYPNLVDEYMNEEFLQCRAILASTIDIVDEINDYLLSLISGRSFNYIF
ncbi:hypothetical protein Lal_00044643 [Lupinus albus]|nr:hypothetical protein Lal_00044643 [Lupinus albus]